jgi:hypothetical protein
LVQAFLKKWWVESDFKAPNLPLSLRFKGSGCHCNSIRHNIGLQGNPNNPVVISRFAILAIVPIEGTVLFELPSGIQEIIKFYYFGNSLLTAHSNTIYTLAVNTT